MQRGLWPSHWPRPEEIPFGVAWEVEAPVSFPSSDEASSLPHLTGGKSCWKAHMEKPSKLFYDAVNSDHWPGVCQLCPSAHPFEHICAKAHYDKVWGALEKYQPPITYSEARCLKEFRQTELCRNFGLTFNHLDGSIEIFNGRCIPELAAPRAIENGYAQSTVNHVPPPPVNHVPPPPSRMPLPQQQPQAFSHPTPSFASSGPRHPVSHQTVPPCVPPRPSRSVVNSGFADQAPSAVASYCISEPEASARLHSPRVIHQQRIGPDSLNGNSMLTCALPQDAYVAAQDALRRGALISFELKITEVAPSGTSLPLREPPVQKDVFRERDEVSVSTTSPPSREPPIQELSFGEGDEVECNYSGTWYAGKVQMVNGQLVVAWHGDTTVTSLGELEGLLRRPQRRPSPAESFPEAATASRHLSADDHIRQGPLHGSDNQIPRAQPQRVDDSSGAWHLEEPLPPRHLAEPLPPPPVHPPPSHSDTRPKARPTTLTPVPAPQSIHPPPPPAVREQGEAEWQPPPLPDTQPRYRRHEAVSPRGDSQYYSAGDEQVSPGPPPLSNATPGRIDDF